MVLGRCLTGRIPLIFVTISVAAIACVALCRFMTASRYALRSQEYNFGEANIGETVRHVFTVGNPSPGPLRIEGVKSSCSCSVVGDLPESIPPWSTCEIPIAVTLNMEGERVGSSTMLVLGGHSPITLAIAGSVYRQHPSVIDFGRVKRGERVQRVFRIRSLTQEDLQILDVKCDDTYFDVPHARAQHDPRHVEVTVALKENIPFGSFESSLQLTTSDNAPRIKMLSVKGYVERPIEIEPDRLALGLIRSDEEKTVDLRLFAPYGGRLSVESVEVLPNGTARVDLDRTVMTNGGVTIPVVVRGGFKGKVLKGVVKISARVAEEQRMCVVDFYAVSGDSRAIGSVASSPAGSHGVPSAKAGMGTAYGAPYGVERGP